jgi:hypothetical protein
MGCRRVGDANTLSPSVADACRRWASGSERSASHSSITKRPFRQPSSPHRPRAFRRLHPHLGAHHDMPGGHRHLPKSDQFHRVENQPKRTAWNLPLPGKPDLYDVKTADTQMTSRGVLKSRSGCPKGWRRAGITATNTKPLAERTLQGVNTTLPNGTGVQTLCGHLFAYIMPYSYCHQNGRHRRNLRGKAELWVNLF